MQTADFYKIFLKPLEQLDVDYFVTGSIASIFYGEPRLTHDIDLVVHLKKEDIVKLIKTFDDEHYYCPPHEVIQIEINRRPYGHFNLIHHESGLKADVYPDANDLLHAWALKNRKRVQLQADQSFWLAPPEYLIIRKLEFYRLGGSEKHLIDIAKLLPNVDLDSQFLQTELKSRGLVEYFVKIQSRVN